MAINAEFRLALILSRSRKLLAYRRTNKAIVLPRVGIRALARPAHELTLLLLEKWHIRAILLEILGDHDSEPPLAVVEVKTDDWRFETDGFLSIDPCNLETLVPSGTERHCLTAILEGRTVAGPFSRLGWIDEARQWISDALPEKKIVFSEDVQQFNAGGQFALIRFSTREERLYWLKATGTPNTHEFAITIALAQHLPEHLPPVVAYRKDWNAWVMENAGAPLSSSLTFSDAVQAFRALGAFQLKAVPYTALLLDLGCIDGRLSTLRLNTSRLMKYLEEAMARQTSTKVPRLEPARLQELALLTENACSAMESLRVPDSLIQNDANPGNVLINGSSCVFTDWAEAGIGNPFLTFEVLSCALAQSANTDGWADSLKGAYREAWRSILSMSQMDRAFALAPLIAIVSHLYGRGTWLDSERRNDPNVQSYARGLARRMDRIARTPELAEALCH